MEALKKVEIQLLLNSLIATREMCPSKRVLIIKNTINLSSFRT